MGRHWCQVGAHVTAVLVLLSLAADMVLKDSGDLQQAFWACYWAAVAVALGIIFGANRLVCAGLVFFLGVGVPAWIVGRLAEEQVDPTSVLIHFLPVLAGFLYIEKLRSLPQRTAMGAWTFVLVPLLVARAVCDPVANINLAHQAWPPLNRYLPYLWEFHVLILAFTAATVTLAAWIIDHILAAHAHLEHLVRTPAKAA